MEKYDLQQNVMCTTQVMCLFILVGADFNNKSITITIPAGTKKEFEITNTFFKDDNINEIDQSFALVGVLGDDIPDRFACFQRQKDNPACFGRTGATIVKIEDNDGKALFFSVHAETFYMLGSEVELCIFPRIFRKQLVC